MRTLIVSDLHLGSRTRIDVLRRPELRAALLDRLQDVDRLVLLGDVLELRHGPPRDALNAARPFFEELGRACAGREIVVVAGNHDHALVEPWLQTRALADASALVPEQRIDADEASPLLATLARWAAPAHVSAAYPGLWLRPDVYATHGHYLDCHLTVPTMERLGIGAVGRMLRRPARSLAGADDYEAVMRPVFAWIDAMAQQTRTGSTLNGQSTVHAWRTLGGDRNHRPSRRSTALRNRALAGAFPLAIAALNRTGIGPFNADISGPELRRAGLRAMGEVVARLDLGEVNVIFGHTHRAGPLPRDEQDEWLAPGGARLMNCGSWSYDGYFLNGTGGANPYWPGGCVLVQEQGPPVLRRLLSERTAEELMAAPA